MQINMNGNRVVIDGKSFSGRSVSIINGKVIVDGIEQPGSLIGDINVTAEGNIDKLENASGSIKANNVNTISTQSGNITCGDVNGSVSTMSGDVRCNSIGGSVTTMSGDIITK